MNLTDGELARLRTLVIREAEGIGYGTKYNDGNRKNWPDNLKRLRTLSNKLAKEQQERRDMRPVPMDQIPW